MLLAGDVGGTKTMVGLFRSGETRPVLVELATFTTLDFPDLESMVAAFLQGKRVEMDACAFGVAGAVVAQVAHLTNVPWLIDGPRLEQHLDVPVAILNDLEAMSYAIPVLQDDEVCVLQTGRPRRDGARALIAAGTGLGEAALLYANESWIAVASEGGHADFAARTPREIELLQYLTDLYGRAEVEHVVSGPGLINIYRFVHQSDPDCPVRDAVADDTDAPAAVSASALAGDCPRCVETLSLMVSAYGAEAGNLGLRVVATGGVYIGGGIAPKILQAFQDGRFVAAFRAKAPLEALVADMPVSIILNERAGLIGASMRAAALAQEGTGGRKR